MFPYLCRTVTPREVCIVPCKNIPPVQCLCTIELVPKSTVEVVPMRHMRKTLASILSEKAIAVIKRIRECRTHSTTREEKKKKSGKSVQVLWHSTSYLKPVIRSSNMVGLPQHLTISFLA